MECRSLGAHNLLGIRNAVQCVARLLRIMDLKTHARILAKRTPRRTCSRLPQPTDYSGCKEKCNGRAPTTASSPDPFARFTNCADYVNKCRQFAVRASICTNCEIWGSPLLHYCLPSVGMTPIGVK